jgi:mannose-6-phosphate isomerase-like protein (cupin superfamily)
MASAALTPATINNAEHYTWGEDCDGWHLVKTENLSVIQERVPPGKSERKHFHEKSRQFFYVLEGTATLEVGDQLITLREREGIEISPSVPHRLLNNSTKDLEFLVISAPRSHGDRTDV